MKPFSSGWAGVPATIRRSRSVTTADQVILTEALSRRPSGERKLTHQPDVHVASSTAQVINIVTQIEQRRTAPPALLSAFAMAK